MLYVFYITTIPYLPCSNKTVWILLHGYNLNNVIYFPVSPTATYILHQDHAQTGDYFLHSGGYT